MVNALHLQVPDGGWTAAARDAFNARWATMFTSISNPISTRVACYEHRFYNLPATSGPMGDPAFTTEHPTMVGLGSAATEMAPQVAATVTFQTAIRRRWGRIYLGGLVAALSVSGRIDASSVGVIGAAFRTFAAGLISDSLPLVIWHRASWTPEPVTIISMDDVFDVQRRRRYDSAVTRYEGTPL
jgi:hypothetical protein